MASRSRWSQVAGTRGSSAPAVAGRRARSRAPEPPTAEPGGRTSRRRGDLLLAVPGLNNPTAPTPPAVVGGICGVRVILGLQPRSEFVAQVVLMDGGLVR